MPNRVTLEDMASDSKRKSQLIIRAATEKKATELILLEMKGITTYTDYFLICSGKSDRQVQAIARGLRKFWKSRGYALLASRELSRGNGSSWIMRMWWSTSSWNL